MDLDPAYRNRPPVSGDIDTGLIGEECIDEGQEIVPAPLR